MNCSDIENDIHDYEGELLGNQRDTSDNWNKGVHIECSDNEDLGKNNGDQSIDEEDSVPLHNIQKRIYMRFPSSSKEDNESREDTQFEIFASGIIWKNKNKRRGCCWKVTKSLHTQRFNWGHSIC